MAAEQRLLTPAENLLERNTSRCAPVFCDTSFGGMEFKPSGLHEVVHGLDYLVEVIASYLGWRVRIVKVWQIIPFRRRDTQNA